MPYRDTPWPAGTPCWTDLFVPDVERAKEFYGAVLGWSFQDTGEEYGHFHICQVEGRTAAGLGAAMSADQPALWNLYLATDDLDATTKLATDNGASVVAGPMDIGSSGRMAMLVDPTGCAFGLWQAGENAGFEVYNQPGSVVWEDARTTDVAAARAFYTTLFGFSYDEVPGVPKEEYGTFGLGGPPLGGLGGMMGAPEGTPGHWLVYFAVAEADAAVAAATERGAEVLMPAQDTPFGRMSILTDPFGATFAVHQELSGG